MDDPTLRTDAAHRESLDPVAYLRGLTHPIDRQRLDYILARTRRQQRRQRRLRADQVVWLVIAMSLFASDSIPMAWRRLHPSADTPEPDQSAFTKARQRLGVAPLRELFREVARPMAAAGTPGAFYRSWRRMGIDGTTFDMPDTPANERIFGRGGNQRSPNAFPQVRVLARCELGTHAIGDIALRPIHGRIVRIIGYTHNDSSRAGCGTKNRLLTDLLHPADQPAREAVLLDHQRWEEELAFDEIKTHLNGRELLLRSKTPRGVVQELYGLFLAHRVIRKMIADAAATRRTSGPGPQSPRPAPPREPTRSRRSMVRRPACGSTSDT